MKRIVIFVCVMCAFVSACGGQVNREKDEKRMVTVIPSPTSTIPSTSEPTSTIEHPTPTTNPTPISTPSPAAGQILLEGIGMEVPGPWLMFDTDKGFWLVNQDGDVVRLMQVSPEYYYQWEVAPQGGLVAMVMDNMSEKILEVVSVQAYENTLALNLVDYEGDEISFDSEQEADDFNVDRFFAVGQSAWSSDGNKLAFVSAHQGPSPDVYVYDVLTGAVTRLTSGPTHAVSLYWSPDDQYILHAGVEKMWIGYSGSGYSGWTFYAARADGSDLTTIFKSEINQGHENIVGWYSDREVLMDSGYWYCGRFDLRMVDIESGDRVSIWLDQYDQIVYDPVEKVALVWVSPDALSVDECGSSGESGLYLVSIPDGRREKVAAFYDNYLVSAMEWVEGAAKYLLDIYTIWALVDIAGEVEYLEEQPIFSADGDRIALLEYKGESLRVRDQDGKIIEVMVGGTVHHPIWSPDGKRLFYFEENETRNSYDLYMVRAPGYSPIFIQGDMFEKIDGAPEWVMP